MSNALAIASVTRLLKDLLNDTLINGDIGGQVGTDVLVSALPPDRVIELVDEATPNRLNIYLHRITPNAALANADLPTRDDRSQLLRRPRLALDLHYLLTAYTTQELHGEILLGYAMEMFHETPVLARNQVRAALQGGLNGAILPPAFQGVDPARLADQLELIRITPQTLTMDDMSKLWTAFQTHYRTTVAYTVSVVLIERELPVRPALPVLSRGRVDPASGRDAGVAVQPDLLPPSPMVTALAALGGRPAMRLGDALIVLGHHLDEGDARVRFTAPESGRALELTPDATPSPGRLQVSLPSGPALAANHPLAGTGADPGTWRIGTYLVDVQLTGGSLGARQTNQLPIALAPRATPSATVVANGTRIDVACSPRIRAGQPVAIVAARQEQPVPAPAADTASVSAVFAALTAGAQLPVRLRVAGIESLLIEPDARPPRFDPTQLVTVP